MFWILGACVLASILIYIATFYNLSFTNCPSDFGIFGDYIGGVVGTLVGLIGIVFLYRTYRIQVDISNHQEAKQDRQQFETAFFSLLSQQRNILQNLEGEFQVKKGLPLEKVIGYQFLSRLRLDLSLRLLDLNYEPKLLNTSNTSNTNLLKIQVNCIYQELFQGYADQLGHYFRHLYHLLKFVDESELFDKKKYMDLIQSQMSSDELYLTAINGISNYGRKRMLPLLNNYSFLENLIIDDDPIVADLIRIFYPNTKKKSITSMSKNIIFIGGIHAVGKTFFTNFAIADNPQLKLLSCSEVLKWKDPTEKEVDNVAANQDLLIENLQKIVDIDKPYLLDGHFCLMNKNGEIEQVPSHIFRSINPVFIVLLYENIDIVAKRLFERDGKKYDQKLLEQLSNAEREWAMKIADDLSIPVYLIKSSEYLIVKNEIMKFVEEFK